MVTVIAHRGARSLTPENTLAAARKAHQLGADMWETDVEGNRSVAASFEVEVISGVGHFLQLEDPAGFNIALRKVLHEFWPAQQH